MSEGVGDQLKGELVWRQPNTEQGLGKQHLQSTVNMGKEQSGLFPLGIYSRGNEKKGEREMRSH